MKSGQDLPTPATRSISLAQTPALREPTSPDPDIDYDDFI